MTSWLDLDETDPFGLQTLAYGVFSTSDRPAARVGVRIGRFVLDAAAAAEQAGMESGETWACSSLNRFLARGPRAWGAARDWLTLVLTDESYRDAVEPHLHPLNAVQLHLPFEVADYVDFYASEHHATNLGAIFRPDNPTLPTAWRHLPIAYHGRAGTVVVSGTGVVRPNGQRRHVDGDRSHFGPSTRLDIEAEVGFVLGGATAVGTPVPLADASDHLFGVVLLNDWSARDIQAWEYVPLGPFLGKSFATSISAWVTPMAALQAARLHLDAQEPRPHDYLHHETDRGLDLHLEVALNGTVVTRPEYRHMYWSPEQMLAHLTVNGASLRDGDLIGSGTVSGADPGTLGSLVELTGNGEHPLALADGSSRGFLEDGDVVDHDRLGAGPERYAGRCRRGDRPDRAGSPDPGLLDQRLPDLAGGRDDRRSGMRLVELAQGDHPHGPLDLAGRQWCGHPVGAGLQLAAAGHPAVATVPSQHDRAAGGATGQVVPGAGTVGDVDVGPRRLDDDDRQGRVTVHQRQMGRRADIVGQPPQHRGGRGSHQRGDGRREARHRIPQPNPAVRQPADVAVRAQRAQQPVCGGAAHPQGGGQRGDRHAGGVLGPGEQIEQAQTAVEGQREGAGRVVPVSDHDA